MRVTRCFIGGYREIKDSSFSPEGLVVLVGANGTGKTSALEALRLALAPPPDDDDAIDLSGLGRIWLRVELDGLGIADHRDNDLWDELLTLKHLYPGTEDEFSVPGQGPELERVQELLADAPTATATATAIEILTDFLVESGPGNPVDRREVVEAALAQTSLLIGLQTVRLLFPGEDLTHAPLVEAAGRLTAINDDSADPVLDWADAIVDGRNVPGLLLASRGSWEIALPHPHVLSTDPADLEAGVAAAIEVAHDIRYQYVSKLVIPDRVLLGIVSNAASDRLDPWLESLEEDDDESEPESPGPDDWAMNVTIPAALMRPGAQIQLDPRPLPKQAPDHWVRLKPTIVATAEYFSAWANELAPSFISDLGTIQVEIQAPAAWQTYEARVRIFFVRSDLSKRPLEELSDGIRRWVAATLRLAAHRFTGASQAFLVEDDQTLDVDAADDLVDRARADPYDQALVTLIPSDSDPDVIWLIDEPESHLHPAAVTSVVKWLRARATESAGAAVATHHPAFLSIPAEAGQVVLATRDAEGCHLKTVSGGTRRSVSLIAAEFGLRPAELLSLTRLVLFVEGPHDVIVLESFIGEELESLGILVLPMHGVDNGLSALLESEILTELDLKLAVLTDDTSPERITTSDPRSRIERAAVRLKREVHMRGGQIETLGLRKPDVLQYLDDEVCRAAAPAFPGWDKALEECRRSGDVRDFKKFVTRTYQLDLGRESVRRLATETRLQGRVSKEFERIVRQLASVSGKSDEFFEEFTKQASP